MDTKRMHDEISVRMQSRSWDYEVASYVISEKKQQKEKRLFSGAAASLATAAIAVAIFLFELNSTYSADSLYSGLNSTAAETYDPSDDTLIAELDIIINEAYPMR